MDEQIFLQVMNEVDDKLRNEGTPIHSRSFGAIQIICQSRELQQKLGFNPEYSAVRNYIFNWVSPLAKAWYQERYGDRTTSHMGPGSYPIFLKHEPWEMNLPLLLGSFSFTVNSNLDDKCNILRFVKGMTSIVANNIGSDEKEYLLKEFLFAMNAVESLRRCSGSAYMNAARSDYDTAVDRLFSRHPNYCLSKWSSLQLVEKSIKSVLVQKGSFNKKKDRTYDLHTLARRLKNDLGIDLPRKILNDIQCSPGVRYEEEQVSLIEAASAARQALYLFSILFSPNPYSIELNF